MLIHPQLKACKRFKKLLGKESPEEGKRSLFGDESRFVQPPEPIREQKIHIHHEKKQ